jgi:hypothetical protein
VSSKNLREGSENLLPGKELGIGSVICYYGSDESVNIPGDSDWCSRPYIFFILRKKYNKPYIFVNRL